MGFGIREGRRQARENLSSTEGGDCGRCGGGATSSNIPGYLQCVKCGYEWKDPEAEMNQRGPGIPFHVIRSCLLYTSPSPRDRG